MSSGDLTTYWQTKLSKAMANWSNYLISLENDIELSKNYKFSRS